MIYARRPPVPTQRPQISVITTEEIRAALEKLANSERRSLSGMAEILIIEGLKARGLLDEES